MMAKQSPGYKKTLFIITLATVFIFLEICARLSVYYHYRRDIKKFNNQLLEIVHPLDRREYVLRKNAIFITKEGVTYKTNKKGLRGTEYSYEKPSDVHRILMLGDSYLFGWGLNLDDTLPVILEKCLNKKYEVINAGIYGYNTVQEIEYLKREGIRYNPDVVIIYFVMNDIEPQWNVPRHPKYEYEYCVSWFFDHVIRRLNDFISKWSNNSEVFFTVGRSRQNTSYLRAFKKEKYKWVACKNAIAEFSHYSKEKKFIPYIIIIPDFSQNFREYKWTEIHSKVKTFAMENGIKTLDLLDYFKGLNSAEFQISVTENHPNKHANEIIAQQICKFLNTEQQVDRHN